MLAVALIFFREVLEAALVIGILAAATSQLAGRTKWLVAGLAAGLGGAVLVAGFAEQLASAAEGMGQELFNAGVLFLAVLMLGWHTVWMSRHSRAMAADANAIAASVASGGRPMRALAVVVGLAVLREGSEIVLFSHGMLAGGSAELPSLATGAVLGLVAGVGTGFAVFKGLKLVPTRSLFAVTTGLITLLAAGMAARGVAFLNQAGAVTWLTDTAWDTSALIPDHGMLGQTLAALIGYTAAPMQCQVLAYLATLAVLYFSARWVRASDHAVKPAGPRLAGAVCAVICLGILPTRNAEAGFKVYSPYVEQGEWEFEFRGHRTVDNDPTKDDGRKFLYEIGYSPTAFWHTAVFLEAEGGPGEPNDTSAVAFENIFQLTDPGQYWLDVGAYVEYEKGLNRDGAHALEWKLLLEKDFGHIVVVANPIWKQGFSDHGADGVGFEYAWGTYYRLRPELEPGFEAYGEIGELTNPNAIDAQEHFIGPVTRGMFKLGGTQKLKYDLGYLFGATGGSADGAFKFELEYEVRF